MKLCTIALNIIRIIRWVTTPMNELGFIGQESLVVLGKSATIYKFKQRCGLMLVERLVLSNCKNRTR
jgi:hypothetical protein